MTDVAKNLSNSVDNKSLILCRGCSLLLAPRAASLSLPCADAALALRGASAANASPPLRVLPFGRGMVGAKQPPPCSPQQREGRGQRCSASRDRADTSGCAWRCRCAAAGSHHGPQPGARLLQGCRNLRPAPVSACPAWPSRTCLCS